MEKAKLGRAILTFTLIAGWIVSFAMDYNETHLWNQSWPAHARFHDAHFLTSFLGISLMSLWLLWRRAQDRLLGAMAAGITVAVFWLPNFFITTLVPGTSLLVEVDEVVPKAGGVSFFPAALIGAVLILLAAAGYWFAAMEDRNHV